MKVNDIRAQIIRLWNSQGEDKMNLKTGNLISLAGMIDGASGTIDEFMEYFTHSEASTMEY